MVLKIPPTMIYGFIVLNNKKITQHMVTILEEFNNHETTV